MNREYTAKNKGDLRDDGSRSVAATSGVRGGAARGIRSRRAVIEAPAELNRSEPSHFGTDVASSLARMDVATVATEGVTLGGLIVERAERELGRKALYADDTPRDDGPDLIETDPPMDGTAS